MGKLEATLKTLPTEDPEYRPILDYLCGRQAHRRFTDVYNFSNSMKKHVKSLDRAKLTKAVVRLFGRFAEIGIGKFVDERGRRPRFEWFFETRSVGRCSIGVGSLKPASNQLESERVPHAAVEQNRLSLGDGRAIVFEGPSYLTKSDIEKINKFLNILEVKD